MLKHLHKLSPRTLRNGLAGTALVVAGNASAQGTDFSSILSGLSATTVITAILAACVIIAGVGFAKWGGKKLAKFFG